MYHSMIKAIKDMAIQVSDAQHDAQTDLDDLYYDVTKPSALATKLCRIQTALYDYYTESAVADNMVMKSWVEQSAIHQLDIKNHRDERILQGYAYSPNHVPYPYAFSSHVRYVR